MKKLFTTKNLVLMALFGALAGLLMLWDFPLTFLAPNFYKMDFSEIPALIGGFAIGPLGGVIIEAVKILVKLLFKPTTTGLVGEFANFVLCCALVLPASLLYHYRKTLKTAILSLAAGTLFMTGAGIVVNALVMLPFYSKFMPMESIIAAGAKIFPAVNSVWTFAAFCVGPFNLFKALAVSLLTLLLYKRVSNLIKSFDSRKKGQKEA